MSNLVNWDNLKPYNSNQNKSFEELCYQLAFEEFSSLGELTSIDDSGGGDGVEFYLKLPNGDIWGWQCKFFGRFNEGGRKNQIKSSLQKAYDTHGNNLKKWILCSRLSLTNEEKKWFETSLAISQHRGRTVLPQNHSVILNHWGDTKIINLLRKHSDIHRYFFTDKVLDFNWFENKFNIVASSSIIKARYLNGLHVAGVADETVIQIIADARLADLIEHRKEILEVDRFLKEYEEEIVAISSEENIFEFKEDYKKIKEFIVSNDYPKIIQKGNKLLDKAQDFLRKEDFKLLSLLIEDIKVYQEELTQFYSDYSNFREPDLISSFHWDTEEDEKDEGLKRNMEKCRNTVLGPYYTLRNYIDAYINIFYCFDYKQLNELHIAGQASKGKTHLAANIIEHQIKQGKPAIFLFGKDFRNTSPLKNQLKGLLDLPSDWSVSDFLGALNISGRVNNSKAILLIDGLNESIYWKQIWGSNLELLINEINQNYPSILLITTYRESYERELFPENYFHSSVDSWKKKTRVDGFDNDNLDEAIKRYFKHYDIKLLNHSAAMNHFSEPLYLKIFCETKQGQEVSFQKEDLFDVFDQYLEKSNKNIVKNLKLSLRYNKKFSQKILRHISNKLWESSRRDINLNDLVPSLLNEDQLIVFEGEDLLIFRDWGEQEIITFTYDLLSGYLIAQTLIEDVNSKEELLNFIESDKFKKELFIRESLHPLYNDIFRCFCILVIKKFGLSFYFKEINENFKHYLLHSLFEINTSSVIENKKVAIELVTEKFNNSTRRNYIYSLFTHTELDFKHPLNFDLLSSLLFNLSMSDRDVSWTEYTRNEYGDYSADSLKNFIEDFETTCKDTSGQSNKIHLASKKIMWLLTSTNREMRDRATKALYYYGVRYSNEFIELVEYSLGINDPYVWERMLVSLYGIILSKHNDLNSSNFRDKMLKIIAIKLYKLVFAPNAPYSTTHILARDYARRGIELCLKYHPNILNKKEVKHIRPPYTFGGIREWGEYDYGDKDYGYNEPMRMDFSNYTIGTIVPKGHSYSNPPEKQKVRRQIYWRIYDLGWESEKFTKAEEGIGNENHRNSRTEKPKTERYGKKYSWVAFYELYGFREDNNLVKKEWSNFRPSQSDIDPTFPEFPENKVFIDEDFLGDRSTPLIDWYNNAEQPKLDFYLTVNNLDQRGNDWVCLNGFLSQRDKGHNREQFIFIRGIIVKENEYDEFLNLLQKKDFRSGKILGGSENYYTYAGEMNTVEEATYSNFREVQFEISRQKKIVKKGDKGYYHNFSFDGDGLTMNNPSEIEIEEVTTKDFEILLPVAEYNWESHHSSVNHAGHQSVVSKEFSLHLNLINQPQTFNLFEKNGTLASINLRYYEDYNTNQHFVYLRKDLFDKFLKDNNYKFIWNFWGERQFNFDEYGAVNEFIQENDLDGHKEFKKIKPY